MHTHIWTYMYNGILQSNKNVQTTDKSNEVSETQDTMLSGRVQALKCTLHDLICIEFTGRPNYFLLIEIGTIVTSGLGVTGEEI